MLISTKTQKLEKLAEELSRPVSELFKDTTLGDLSENWESPKQFQVSLINLILLFFIEHKLGKEYSEANKFFAENILFTDTELFNILNPKGRAQDLWWCNDFKKTKDYN